MRRHLGLIEAFVRSGAPARIIPFPLQSLVLETLLEKLLGDAFSRGDLDFLKNRWVRIRVQDAGFLWSVSCGTHGLVLTQDKFPADAEFSGLLEDYLLLAARRVDPDTLFFQRRIEIYGDTDLALTCKNLLDSVDDEQLAWPLRSLLAVAADKIEHQREL